MATHSVDNQPPPLVDYDAYSENRPLVGSVQTFGAGWAEDRLHAIGRAATGEPLEWGRLANDNPPVLKTHDRYGNRIDEVEFHPAWHQLMEVSVENAIHSLPWREPRPGAHVARGALMIAISQSDSGVGCPISMTYAAVPALRAQPEVAAEWEPKLTSTDYDPRLIPIGEKRGAICGMGMTEKQGGSDVRANTTRAAPVASRGPGETYRLTGHKWFCSAPMSDAFLVLAQAEGGLSCFLLPRVLPDGTRNTFRIQRLKNKLGNRSNASSEVEFEDTIATMIGEEGRGVPTIIEMVNHTRLDCVLGSTALMREAVAQATHHAAHRTAFGKLLIDQPLMQNVLADLCIESEAATITALRLAHAFDNAPNDDRETAFKRLATAVSKYWVCKTAVAHVGEALECLGGNGYVEDSGMPRLYKESPLNSIWEGSGNVNCLDVLRAMGRSPQAVEAFFDELEAAGDRRVSDHATLIKAALADGADLEMRARRVVEAMALGLQASLLIRFGDPTVAEAFVVSRLGGDHGRTYGTLPPGLDLKAIVERHRPQV